MTTKIRVLICDDHSLFREGLRAILREQPAFEVVGEGRNGLLPRSPSQCLTS